MLTLHTKELELLSSVSNEEKIVARITTNEALPEIVRGSHILLLQQASTAIAQGFAGCFVMEQSSGNEILISEHPSNCFYLPSSQSYLSDGDVVVLNPKRGSLKTLYRRAASYNALLLTERCNNFCLMCSQPPKPADDSFLIDEIIRAIPLMDRSTPEIGISGGEPTLLGPDLIRIIKTLKSFLPETAVHVLSNGRHFHKLSFAGTIASIQHPDLMIGIPIYSDISNIHDYVVQADGAFDETIRGILNLKRYRQKVEIRVVIHKQTYARLPQLAEFIARNLLFVDHVALMGLEMTGFTKHNLEDLWIDPLDYQPQLKAAVEILARYRMNVSIYNHQLCVLDRSLWKYNKKSISDWKNEYMPECSPCTQKTQCGGFFSSARLRYSAHIAPFEDIQEVF
jgi:His-Xaa-Ser system radical SAM maturase HxsC